MKILKNIKLKIKELPNRLDRINYTLTLSILLVCQWGFMLSGIYAYTLCDSIFVLGLFIFASMNCFGLTMVYKRELLKDFERAVEVNTDIWKAMSRFKRRKFAQAVKSGKIKLK